MKNIIEGWILGFLLGVGVAILVLDNPPIATVSTEHAALAVMACSQLGLESVTIRTKERSVDDVTIITSTCSQGVQVLLEIPRIKVLKKVA